MSENNDAGSWSEFLSRVRQYTDMMLERLRTVSIGKDSDDRDARSLNSLILKSLRIWQSSLARDRQDPGYQNPQRPTEKREIKR